MYNHKFWLLLICGWIRAGIFLGQAIRYYTLICLGISIVKLLSGMDRMKI